MTVLKGTFATRRDAEMAVERLVQEFRIDLQAIEIAPDGAENSAGEEPGGSDAGGRTASRETAALEGEIVVSVDVADGDMSKVREAFAEFAGDLA